MVRFLALYDEPDEPEAFDRHYREVHIPLAKKLPGLRGYTISRNAVATRDREAYYLIAELDWDDMTDLRHAFERLRAALPPTMSPNSRPRTRSEPWSMSSRTRSTEHVTITAEPRHNAEAAYFVEQLQHADPRSQRCSFARAQVPCAEAESDGFRR
jgi:uncharacterized protein (TIGR02118 family)